MLRNTSEIDGYSIGATDGPIGAITDFLFEDDTWLVRWLVVDTGKWLTGREVLLPPASLGSVNHIGRQFSSTLTRQQVEDSPTTSTDEPVSRLMEVSLYDYYGWRPYWSAGFFLGGTQQAGRLIAPPSIELNPQADEAAITRSLGGDSHLRSINEVTGYHINARDGEIGHVADFLIDDADWSLRYLIVDTRNWWPGKKVLIAPRSIVSTQWSARLVNLDVDRQAVRDSPIYDSKQPPDREDEPALHHIDEAPRVRASA